MKEPDKTRGDGGNGRDGRFSVVDRRSTFTDDGAAAPEPRYPSFVEELKKRAEEAEGRAREISAAYRRIEEERDAFRERLSRDLERRLDIARGDLMRKVLTVLDDLERALDAARAGGDVEGLATGVGLVRDQLLRIMSSEGVEPLETVGRPFDPAVAEAVATEIVDDAARDNEVIEELQRGYTLGGTLLRPARVKVARRAQPDPDAPPQDPPSSDPD